MSVPDRPIPALLHPARDLVRQARFRRAVLGSRARIEVGADFALGTRSLVNSPDHFLVGDRVHIGPEFLCEVNVRIGDDVLVSSRVSMVGNDHQIEDTNETVYSAPRLPPATVALGGDNLIGHGSVILGSIYVGKGCVVGAGSLVTTDLPEESICYGRPAKPIRMRRRSERAE